MPDAAEKLGKERAFRLTTSKLTQQRSDQPPPYFAQRSLFVTPLLCEGREGSEELADSIEIRVRDPVEYQASSDSPCAVSDFAISAALGFPDPDTRFQLRSRRQRDRHFNVTSADAEICNRCPKKGSVLGMKFHRIMALEPGVLPLLNDSWLVIVGCRRR